MKIYAHTSRFDINKIVGQDIWVKARIFNAMTQRWFGGIWWVRVIDFDGKYYHYDILNSIYERINNGRLVEDTKVAHKLYGLIHPIDPINLITSEELFGGE